MCTTAVTQYCKEWDRDTLLLYYNYALYMMLPSIFSSLCECCKCLDSAPCEKPKVRYYTFSISFFCSKCIIIRLLWLSLITIAPLPLSQHRPDSSVSSHQSDQALLSCLLCSPPPPTALHHAHMMSCESRDIVSNMYWHLDLALIIVMLKQLLCNFHNYYGPKYTKLQ